MMIADHTKMGDELKQKVGGTSNVTVPTGPDQDHQEKFDKPNSNTTIGRARSKDTSRRSSCFRIKEALERQTATADILKVIASSPSDVQPVFEAIATSANRLLGGFSSAVFLFVNTNAFQPSPLQG